MNQSQDPPPGYQEVVPPYANAPPQGYSGQPQYYPGHAIVHNSYAANISSQNAPLVSSAYGVAPPGYTSQPPHNPHKYGIPNPNYVQQPVPSYGSTMTTVVQQHTVVVGGCPSCRVGVLEDDFTCCGVCCAIMFFPLGLICCLAMKQRRCPNCGATFGWFVSIITSLIRWYKTISNLCITTVNLELPCTVLPHF